jgi:hypothetical protein
MARRDRILSAFTAAVDTAELDRAAPVAPVDERVVFDKEALAAAMGLLATASDRELAVETADALMRSAIWALDERRGLAALKLLEKLEVAGRRIYKETDSGLEAVRPDDADGSRH